MSIRDRSRNKEFTNVNVNAKQAQYKNLNKYKPKFQGEIPKTYTREEKMNKKEIKGNTITLQANEKNHLYELYNKYLIHILPQKQKHKFEAVRESKENCFFNMTELEFDVMNKLETVIRQSDLFLDGYVLMDIYIDGVSNIKEYYFFEVLISSVNELSKEDLQNTCMLFGTILSINQKETKVSFFLNLQIRLIFFILE